MTNNHELKKRKFLSAVRIETFYCGLWCDRKHFKICVGNLSCFCNCNWPTLFVECLFVYRLVAQPGSISRQTFLMPQMIQRSGGSRVWVRVLGRCFTTHSFCIKQWSLLRHRFFEKRTFTTEKVPWRTGGRQNIVVHLFLYHSWNRIDARRLESGFVYTLFQRGSCPTSRDWKKS